MAQRPVLIAASAAGECALLRGRNRSSSAARFARSEGHRTEGAQQELSPGVCSCRRNGVHLADTCANSGLWPGRSCSSCCRPGRWRRACRRSMAYSITSSARAMSVGEMSRLAATDLRNKICQ